jgi:hypothetical protein
MPKLEFDELMFEKETQSFNRYRLGRILSDDDEVRCTLYMPKKSMNIKVTIEYE